MEETYGQKLSKLDDDEDFEIGVTANSRGASLQGHSVQERHAIEDIVLLDGISDEILVSHRAIPFQTYGRVVDFKSDFIMPKIVTRTEFPDFIVIKPQELTSAHTDLTIKAPDSVTKYKVIVMLAKENRFGYTERSILVRNPIFTATQNPPCIKILEIFVVPSADGTTK
jgi:hypothetical protein